MERSDAIKVTLLRSLAGLRLLLLQE